MAAFRKKIVLPRLGSVTSDFQVVQIAFTHVIQFRLLQSREVGKRHIIMPILLRTGCSAQRGKVITSESPEGTDFIIMFPAHLRKGST